MPSNTRYAQVFVRFSTVLAVLVAVLASFAALGSAVSRAGPLVRLDFPGPYPPNVAYPVVQAKRIGDGLAVDVFLNFNTGYDAPANIIFTINPGLADPPNTLSQQPARRIADGQLFDIDRSLGAPGLGAFATNTDPAWDYDWRTDSWFQYGEEPTPGDPWRVPGAGATEAIPTSESTGMVLFGATGDFSDFTHVASGSVDIPVAHLFFSNVGSNQELTWLDYSASFSRGLFEFPYASSGSVRLFAVPEPSALILSLVACAIFAYKLWGSRRPKARSTRGPLRFHFGSQSLEPRMLLAADWVDNTILWYTADEQQIELVGDPTGWVAGYYGSSVEQRQSAKDAKLPADWRHDASLSSGVLVVNVSGGKGVDLREDSIAMQFVEAGYDWATPAFRIKDRDVPVYIGNEVIVALKEGASLLDLRLDAGARARPLRGTADQFVVSLEGAGEFALRFAHDLAKSPSVDWAVPNTAIPGSLSSIPNDPLFSHQWGANNTGQFGAKVDADIDLPEAWDTVTGNSNLVVAVLDSGVQTNHPDLAIATNPYEIAGNGIDDDRNGWVDDAQGWDFFAHDNNPNPETGQVPNDNHGTAVAGIAAALGNNAQGVTGVSQSAKVLPIKIFRLDVLADAASLAEAIYYAAGRTADGLGRWRGADVLVNSWERGAADSAVTAAFNWAADHGRNERGCLVVAASGNAAAGIPYTQQYAQEQTPVTSTFQVPADGQWSWALSYFKTSSTMIGDDSLRVARFQNSDGIETSFNAIAPPTGWFFSNVPGFSGQPGFYMEDDPGRAYGTGRYQARSVSINAGQEAVIMAPAVPLTAGTQINAKYWMWYSIDLADSNNRGRWYLYNHTTGQKILVRTTANGAPATVDGQVSYPANLSKVLAIGASTDWDYRSHYSQWGAALDLVAPSNGGYRMIATTDRTGSDGYGSGDYLDSVAGFSGTSAATPVVGGLAALLLAKNPQLTRDQLRNSLKEGAEKIGSVTYDANGFNQFYGYGRVNAKNSVDLVAADTTRPRVVNVRIDNGGNATGTSTDDHSFYGNVGTGPTQLKTIDVGFNSPGQLPRITVVFSEPVDVLASDLTVKGKDYQGNEYAFTLDAAKFRQGPGTNVGSYIGTWEASWVVTEPLGARRMSIKLANDTATDTDIRDWVGNQLDGEWDNPVDFNDTSSQVFPSGTGSAGGAFVFSFTSLPGDANQDNTVATADYAIWAANFGVGSAFVQGDFNGDNSIGSGDYAIWAANFGITFSDSYQALRGGWGIGPQAAALALVDFYLQGERSWKTDALRFFGTADSVKLLTISDFIFALEAWNKSNESV